MAMNYDHMEDCFATLTDKVAYAIENSDLNELFKKLDAIQGPVLVCGVGGSSVVASFLAKVLREKRHILANFIYPRDLNYMDLTPYKSVIAVSYSGRNIGVDVLSETSLEKYLFTGNAREGFGNILYKMPKEESYVSISATLVPICLLFLYYRFDPVLLEKILSSEINESSSSSAYEVMSGYETSTAAMILESSIIEGTLGTCIIHDKYNFCHGRINLSRISDSDLIFLKTDSELDEMLLKNLKSHFTNIICIDTPYQDVVTADLHQTVKAMKLVRNIARSKNIDISDMKELPDNDLFYRYAGKM